MGKTIGTPFSKASRRQASKEKIEECHPEHKGIYGYRRVQVWLKRKHKRDINHKRVRRLMREMGIRALIRKKRPYYGKKEPYVISDNHLNRDFHASKPNKKWVTDMTYLIFNGQKLYLSAIEDLSNNEIVADHISRRNDIKLVIDTLKKAIKNEMSMDSSYIVIKDSNIHPLIQQRAKKIQYKGQYVQKRKRFGQCLHGTLLPPFQGKVF
ncbi:IS3 family transposase [Anoxybacillus rupiensis]|uniref:IS3 family transposase n=1 Tax=Anoxybacteroides rupiense TaxID=311460 RepID=A0ABD5IYV3_9BACL|nr:IS3 family transposase [Anoxybacillus rupiensis]